MCHLQTWRNKRRNYNSYFGKKTVLQLYLKKFQLISVIIYIDEATTKELLKKARTIVKNGVEVDIRKYEVAA